MKLPSHATRAQLERLATALEPLPPSCEDAEAFEDSLIAFILDVSASGFMVPYDWMQDVAARRSETEDASALQGMDLDTFQRTVISHVRADRFVEGHLRKLARTGYLAAVIARARQLSAMS